MLTIRQAGPGELDRVRQFYYDLIDAMEGMEYHPRWQKGIYPDEEMLAGAVERGEMFLTEEDGAVCGAMIINHSVTDGYEAVRWQIEAEPSEVTVVHALGVAPAKMNRGVGSAMVREVIHRARENGQKVIRLDVLVGNLPAEKLYRKNGFAFIERVELFYEDTGLCEFDLYEFRV